MGCPLWVKSRHVRCKKACPLYPRKRTFKLNQWGCHTFMHVSFLGLPLSTLSPVPAFRQRTASTFLGWRVLCNGQNLRSLLMLPSLSLPSLECCFGTSPIQAEAWPSASTP